MGIRFSSPTPMEVLMEHSCKCCDLIFSLVQLLFAFVSIRIAKFSFSEKAVLATQSSMCLHDNIKQIMFKFHTTEICACSHTLKGRWFKSLVYLNDFKLFNCASLCLTGFRNWNQTLLYAYCWFNCVQLPNPN